MHPLCFDIVCALEIAFVLQDIVIEQCLKALVGEHWLMNDLNCLTLLILVTFTSVDGSPRFRRPTVKVEVRTGAIVTDSGILYTGNSFTSNQWYR